MPKPDLLLLHGALGSQAQFKRWVPLLQDNFTVHTLDFEGHGAEPMADRPYRMAHFGENVIAYLDKKGIQTADIFGYSMGGYVALCLAKSHPDRVGKIFTIATKFNWSPQTAEHETRFLDPEKILEKVPKFAAALEKRHAVAGWKEVLTKTKEMMFDLGVTLPLNPLTLSAIQHTVRVGVGDRDNMVSLQETIDTYQRLPFSELVVLPGTEHPVEKIDAARICGEILGFFGGVDENSRMA